MKKRIISAIAALIIFVPLTIIGGIPFLVGTSLLSILGFRELLKLYEKDYKLPIFIKLLSYLSVVTLSICDESIIPCLGLIFIFIFIPIIFIDREEYNFDNANKLFGNIIFVGIMFYMFNYLRTSSLDEFIYVFLIAILTDTFAYFGGRLFGKHKLIPSVSPNKTIEGSIIGSIFGIIIPAIYYMYMISPGMNFLLILLITIILSILGQLGDLLFSSIKRYYKIKDFSNIMPGHGGILDRLDSSSVIALTFIIIKILFM